MRASTPAALATSTLLRAEPALMSRARLLNLGLALLIASTWVVATAHAQTVSQAVIYTASELPRLATRALNCRRENTR